MYGRQNKERRSTNTIVYKCSFACMHRYARERDTWWHTANPRGPAGWWASMMKDGKEQKRRKEEEKEFYLMPHRRISPSLLPVLPFSQHSRLLSSKNFENLRKKPERERHSSFCMSSTVSGLNTCSCSFAIIGDQSSGVWQPCEWS